MDWRKSMMAVASKLSSIAVIVITFILGFAFFYQISNLPKAQKKHHMEEMASQLINFFIFLWIGKIVLNLSVFVQDPLAILAYPSNSYAFYFAFFACAVTFVYKSKRKNRNIFSYMDSFMITILVASFVYEFIQLVWVNDTFSIGYMILLSVLLLFVLLIRDRIATNTLTLIVLVIWLIGILLLAFIQPYVTIFGYIIAPWFLSLLLAICLIAIVINLRKRVS